jgi:hypothetical protein
MIPVFATAKPNKLTKKVFLYFSFTCVLFILNNSVVALDNYRAHNSLQVEKLLET